MKERVKQLFTEFRIPMIDGKWFSAEWMKLNRANLLVFYKRSCPTCAMFLPYLADYYERLKKSKNGIFLVSQDSFYETQSYMEEHNFNFPVVVDAPKYHLSAYLNFHSVPALFLLNSTGKILQSSQGFVREEIIDLMINFENLNGIPPQPFFADLSAVPVLVPG